MTLRQVVAVALIGIASASCGGNNPPEANPQPQATLQSPDRSPAAGPANANRQDARPVASPDAQWTIYCRTLSGPSHVRDARRLKDQLMESSGLRGWYLVHASTETTLFHGYYRAFDDPNDPATRKAQAELETIQKIRDLGGRQLFRQAIFVAIDAGDPDAPAEWNLLNSGGYYTLEIGIYTGSVQRKQAAVDAVREARAQGLAAYYHHGENASSVCIGAWPESAAQTAAPVANNDANKTVVIATDRPTGKLAEGMRNLEQSDRTITVAPSFTPTDPNMIEMMKRFPHRYINGEVILSRMKDRETGKISEVPDPSYIVIIPRRSQNILMQESQLADDGSATQQPQPDFGSAVYGQPTQQPTPPRSTGRLRSLND